MMLITCIINKTETEVYRTVNTVALWCLHLILDIGLLKINPLFLPVKFLERFSNEAHQHAFLQISCGYFLKWYSRELQCIKSWSAILFWTISKIEFKTISLTGVRAMPHGPFVTRWVPTAALTSIWELSHKVECRRGVPLSWRRTCLLTLQ